MKRTTLIALAALCVCPLHAAERPTASSREKEAADAADWQEEATRDGITIYSRLRSGSGLKEYKAVGLIEATPASVFAVIDDTEAYPRFMPYTSECRILKREKGTVLAYQRLELPLVSDRDYTLRSTHETWIGNDGVIYRIRWQPANDLGPAVKPGVQRVSVCEGGWLLEPEGAGATRATYSIFTDSGGTLPPMLANSGSRIAIRKVYEAIRKQVKDPKYSSARSSGGPAGSQ